MMSKQFRQGDVLLVQVAELPSLATRLPQSEERIVLAHGEATGHAHAVNAAHAVMFSRLSESYLKVEVATQLVHEEHAAINLEPGVYKVVRQREFVPEGPRIVGD